MRTASLLRHKRTIPSGEQAGATVKATGFETIPGQPFSQFIGRVSPQMRGLKASCFLVTSSKERRLALPGSAQRDVSRPVFLL
ncbi:hypothetical protein OG806_23780 [Streptomyces sp. NBC_00882]|uniref:hypothetical protein n=1 Tax=Streptomyces sp. NBC_00882 TaxID=2975856 RepID=UPI0038688C6F|nr:hypothetical protein OG806_23780 [Streptomyces sp. NBC_00882]